MDGTHTIRAFNKSHTLRYELPRTSMSQDADPAGSDDMGLN